MLTVALEEKWPVVDRCEHAATWLQTWADLGRAPRTIEAYARGLGEFLQLCEREGIDPVGASRAHVALFVRELTSRPSRRGDNVISIDSGAGLANATISTIGMNPPAAYEQQHRQTPPLPSPVAA